MAKVVFRYKPVRGQLAPLITFGLRIGDLWQAVEAYVDSGATYTVLHAQIAQAAGFDYRRGTLIYLQVGDGSFIPVHLHELELQIGPVRFPATIGFSERLGIASNLMGRFDVLSRFAVCFEEQRGFLTFESSD